MLQHGSCKNLRAGSRTHMITWTSSSSLARFCEIQCLRLTTWNVHRFRCTWKGRKMLEDLVTIVCTSIIKACKSSLPRCNRASCFHAQLQPPRQLPLKGLLLLAPSSSTSWPSFLRKIWDLLDEKSWVTKTRHESPGLVLWKRKTNKQNISTKLLDFKIWNQVSAILLKLLAFHQVLAPGFLAMQLWELLYLWHFHRGKGRRHSSVPSWRRTKIPSALPRQTEAWCQWNVPNVQNFKKPTQQKKQSTKCFFTQN